MASYHNSHLLPWVKPFSGWELSRTRLHQFNKKPTKIRFSQGLHHCEIDNSEIARYVNHMNSDFSSIQYTIRRPNESRLKYLNEYLNGLDTFVGDLLSFFATPLYGIALFGMAQASPNYEFRARVGDQLLRSEALFSIRESKKILHCRYFYILDPLRKKSGYHCFPIGYVTTELDINF